MPTTSNFGWTTPADTDLVKDGALAIRTLGNGIDTSMAELKGGTTGQILSKTSNTDMDFTWINNDQGDITEVAAGTGITVTNGTGPIPTVALSTPVSVANGGTGITSFGTGVATFLGTPSSANLAAALTDETGTGSAVFATSPTLVTPNLGTPSAATLTNATGLPITAGTTGTLGETRGGTNQTTYATGDLLYASGSNTLAKRSIGTSGQVLTVSGGVPTWATASSGSYTQIGSTLTLSGTANSFTSIPGTYQKLVLYVTGVTSASNSTEFQIAINNTSGNLIIPGLYRWGTDAITSSLTTDYIRPIAANMLNNDSTNAWYVEIENYASSTAYKSIRTNVTYMSDTSSKRMTFSFNGIWTSNSAITSIGLNTSGNSLNGGTAILYGVK